MEIRLATNSDLKAVKNITQQTIAEIYPHFYPKGAVDFFMKLHCEKNILDDIMLGKTYLEIELHASLSGKKMYLKRGYIEKEYRNKELENGDWICVDIMKKNKC